MCRLAPSAPRGLLLLAALLEVLLLPAAPLPPESCGAVLPAVAGPQKPDRREQSLVQLARSVSKKRAEVVLAEAAARAALNASAGSAANSTAGSSANSSDPGAWQGSIPLEDFGDLGHIGAPDVDPAELYDRSGLLVELHMPGASLEEIRSGSHGPLVDFLGKLHSALCAAAGVDKSRLVILGLHGRYQQLSGANSSGGHGEHLGPEVLVSLQLTPAAAPAMQASNTTEAPPTRIFSRLRGELQQEASALRRGDLGAILRGAHLSLVSLPASPFGATAGEVDKPTSLSAVMVPIGVSAAFTGVLAWLAT